MTIADRIESYKLAFPRWPASFPVLVKEQRRDVMIGVWVIGNDYRNKTKFYGAFPRGFLPRVHALFPDVPQTKLLHAFSGSLPVGEYTRLDLKCEAELQGSVYDVRALVDQRPSVPDFFPLCISDPPYSSEDAEKYGTPPVNRRLAMAALASVVLPGGHIAWLDTQWPMHRKTQWLTVGRILIQRSTNHRVRVLSIFERQ